MPGAEMAGAPASRRRHGAQGAPYAIAACSDNKLRMSGRRRTYMVESRRGGAEPHTTRCSNGSPAARRRQFSAATTKLRSNVPVVSHDTCGASTTLFNRKSGAL
jgi:hypothetical protein